MWTAYTMALLMGLTGGLHCAGMCGPIMFVLPFHAFSGGKRVAAIALYHLARISVYALLGVTLHSFKNLFTPHVQQYVSIMLGVALLFAGLATFFPALGKFYIKLPWGQSVRSQLGKLIGKPGLAAITASGALNGLLPCGLVYMALSASLVLPTLPQVIGFIYIFGLGTMPILVGLTVFRLKASALKINNIKRISPIIVFFFGCLFVLRGLNLGIPYLSPKLEVANGHVHACCCHKKD